ncbi:MAG: transposase [Nitrososphaerota archaeon]|jgi:hypothetical protein|nr:transposase [Nitrososphaerota archaeon]
MSTVPQPILDTFQQRKQIEKNYIQLRKTKNHYYIYQATSKWDKQRKKPIKTTQLLGTIHPNGTYTPKQQKTTPHSTTKIYQYADTQLCHNLSKDLQAATQNFPNKNELLALSIIRTTNPSPIRLTQTIYQNTYLSTQLNANLTPKNITQTLQTLGEMTEETYDLFAQLTPKGGMFFYDLTSILSYSKKLLLAERGYNPNWEQTGQIKIALAFSTHTYLPAAIDVFYGSMKETKILQYFLKRYPHKDLGFIMDRGFTDYEMLLDFKKQGIPYIVALKKNSTFLPSQIELRGAFVYQKRNVGFSKVSLGEYGFLYLFLDPRLCGLEENLLLGQVAVEKLSVEEFLVERRLAGVIGLVSDLDVEPVVVYEQYKAREEIEQVFDYMKNDLEADRTYLGDDRAVRGYFVVVFLAMRLYFKILQRLHERKLVGKVSVREVLYTLSKMQMIVEPNGREYLCALPKKTEEILKIFSDLIPMVQH